MYLHRFGMVGMAALMIVSLCLGGSVAAQEECDATVAARLESTEEGMQVTEYRFRVDVEVSNDCAHVEYDLIVEELLPNGQTKKVRKPGFASALSTNARTLSRCASSSALNRESRFR